MGVYEQWTHLTAQEKLYLATHPVNAVIIAASKDTAFNETTKRFGRNGHNDETDAFRHCFWSAILSRDIGAWDALIYTTAHESGPDNPQNEKEMDLHNNSVGIKIGSDYWFFKDSNDQISGKCFVALQSGKLKKLE